MENVKLTVWLSTFNQEEYVAQALDSILMQETDFPFEIVAADDCSTDGTQAVILDYQKRYPDKIVTYFTKPNVGGCQKLVDCIEKGLFRGDYIAFLEGDDYWLETNRLQVLVDFLDKHPEYSRVSHKRLVVDENGKEMGYDIAEDVLDKPFTVRDLLEGKLYSDFGSVFRNYYKQVGNQYTPLYLASRNVCDFQDMFITQDFGPVYVMNACFGVYRSRSVAGATNYNSITTQSARCRDHIRLAQAVEDFYQGRYDLTPMKEHQQKRLLGQAIAEQNEYAFSDARDLIPTEIVKKLVPEFLYLAARGRRSDETEFILAQLTSEEKRGLAGRKVWYAVRRIGRKLLGKTENEKLKGYVR